MERFELFLKPSAAKEIEALPTKGERRRVISRIAALADEPRPAGSRKLSGRNLYRLRQGRYRILYTIDGGERTVCVVRIADRKEVYR